MFAVSPSDEVLPLVRSMAIGEDVNVNTAGVKRVLLMLRAFLLKLFADRLSIFKNGPQNHRNHF